MTVDEIIEDVFDLFDEPTASGGMSKYSQDDDVLVTKFINRIYVDVCKRTFCCRASTTISTVAEQREYAMPADCCGIKKIIYNGFPLRTIHETAVNTDRGGLPTEYYQYTSGDEVYIGINPLPKEVYLLSAAYFRKPVAAIGGKQTPSLVPSDYHWVISYGTVAEIFKIDKGAPSAGYQRWSGLYNQAVAEMKYELKYGINADSFPRVK